jgi:hypothetical protein
MQLMKLKDFTLNRRRCKGKGPNFRGVRQPNAKALNRINARRDSEMNYSLFYRLIVLYDTVQRFTKISQICAGFELYH